MFTLPMTMSGTGASAPMFADAPQGPRYLLDKTLKLASRVADALPACCQGRARGTSMLAGASQDMLNLLNETLKLASMAADARSA